MKHEEIFYFLPALVFIACAAPVTEVLPAQEVTVPPPATSTVIPATAWAAVLLYRFG